MRVKKIFIALVDISGYTKFIKLHKVSLLHAEQIVSDLLNEVLQTAQHPLIAHHIEGDSIFFYAESDSSPEMAKEIYKQVELFHEAFSRKESELISNCTICICQACRKIGQLKLKTILHHGQAAFVRVGQFNKIAGEDVILAHRLLKNSIPSSEYILMSKEFYELRGEADTTTGFVENRLENYADFDSVDVRVFYFNAVENAQSVPKASIGMRLYSWINMNVLVLKDFFDKKERVFRNLN